VSARRAPTFVYLGPPKTGSTWLHTLMRQHPRCFVPVIKDIRFFTKYYDHGWDWYLSRFEGASEEHQAVGELSTDYLLFPEAAGRIAAHLPDVRMFCSLRNPIDHAFSYYLFEKRNGRVSGTFEEEFEAYPRIRHFTNFTRNLAPFFDTFPREQIGLFQFENIKHDARAFATEVFDFVGLEAVDGLSYDSQVLPASRARHPLLARKGKDLANTLRRFKLDRAVGFAKSNPVIWGLFFKPYGTDTKPVMAPDTRKRLREHYAPSVMELRRITGLPFDLWDI